MRRVFVTPFAYRRRDIKNNSKNRTCTAIDGHGDCGEFCRLLLLFDCSSSLGAGSGQPHLKVLPRGGLGDNFRPKPLVFVFSACFPLKCLG